MLVYLTNGKIPFVKLNLPFDKQFERIKHLKNKYRPKTICIHYQCEYLTEFATEIYKLKFEEKPDYEHLRFLLKKNLMDRNMVLSNHFDWSKETLSNLN